MAEAVRRSRRGRRVPYAAATTAAVALAVGLAAGCSSSKDDKGAHHAAALSKADITKTSSLPASVPDHLEIPDIGVDAKLDSVGLASDGTMQTPPFDKPMEASWYKNGPTPGQTGAAAIAGHMDTPDTPEAVFYNLKKLKKYEQIEVHRTDGTTAVFAVDEVDTYKKDQFPTQKVYGKTDKAELRLITCGGDLTKDRHWDSNVVVFAHLMGKEA
ncbi:class F sortase [Actinomycetota bacterium Odt1-20B]